jgi:hypothetical protein
MRLPVRLLAQAIRAKFEKHAAMVGVEHLSQCDWASATFVGERHRLCISLAGPTAEAVADGFIAGLDDHEFDLAGHVVASIALAGDRRENGAAELLVELLVVAVD